MRSLLSSITALILLALSTASSAEIVTENVSYRSGDTTMKGMIAYDNSSDAKRPGILVVHEWWGHNDYARDRARQLAAQGYTAISIDMYGDGKTADHPKDAGAFSSAIGSKPELARARFESAHELLKRHSTVDASKTAAIGYCFGGAVVLNMARMGVDIDGVVSYHGSLKGSMVAKRGETKAAIRVYNGAADPFVKAEHVKAFEDEMKAAGVDYELVNYPGVKHSFTNPGATAVGERFGLPLVYDENADKDSWQGTLAFFKQLFER